VTGHDVPEDDMPNLPWPSRRDVPASSDASLSALLAGTELPPAAPPELRPVAEALAALMAAPASDELSGEAEALAVFRRRFGIPNRTHRARRRHAARSPLLSARAAAVVTVAALGIGGLATAAAAGALPAPFQSFAHSTFGAPTAPTAPAGSAAPAAPAASAVTPLTDSSPTPVGPDATGRAASGLCNAWEHGNGKKKGAAFRNLAAAAGGADKIAAYCATVPHPGASKQKQPHGHGKPSAHPAHGGSGGN
jgi:hypothetical protein